MRHPDDRRINYPARIQQVLTYWDARAGAAADDPPLPRVHRTSRRTVAIREVFLTVLHGRATLAQVVDACCERGLLDDLTELSAFETTKRAIRPLCTRSIIETAHYQAQVRAGSVRV